MDFFDTIRADVFRYRGDSSLKSVLSNYLFCQEFRYIFWMRAASAARKKRMFRLVHYFTRFVLYRLGARLGINIPYNTAIQPGFYIGHAGGITVNSKVSIGKNCNISSGVVIGESFRGPRMGIPDIGNSVYVGPGAKIFGKIRIGDNVAIGANCVVTKDMPDMAVVVGIPGRIISSEGSAGYINNCV